MSYGSYLLMSLHLYTVLDVIIMIVIRCPFDVDILVYHHLQEP